MSVTLQSSSIINSMIDSINSITGETSTNLTDAINALASMDGGNGNGSSGLWIKSGTVTFATNTYNQKIVHNMGVMPKIFILYPNFDFVVGTQEMVANIIIRDVWSTSQIPSATALVYENRTSYTTSGTWQSGPNMMESWDENTCVTSYRASAYYYLAGKEFNWIVIGW